MEMKPMCPPPRRASSLSSKPARCSTKYLGNQLDHLMLFRSAFAVSKNKLESYSKPGPVLTSSRSEDSGLYHPNHTYSCVDIPTLMPRADDNGTEFNSFSSLKDNERNHKNKASTSSTFQVQESRSTLPSDYSSEFSPRPCYLLEVPVLKEEKTLPYDGMSSPGTSSSGYSTSGSRHSLNRIPSTSENYYHVVEPEPDTVFYDIESGNGDPVPKRVSSLKTPPKVRTPALRKRSVSQRNSDSKVSLQEVKQSMDKIIADLGSMGFCDPDFENLTELVSAKLEAKTSRKVAIEIPPYHTASLCRQTTKLQKSGSIKTINSINSPGKAFNNNNCPAHEAKPVSLDNHIDTHVPDLSTILRTEHSAELAQTSTVQVPYGNSAMAESDNLADCFEPIYETIAGDENSDFDIVEHSDTLRDVPPKLPARNYQSAFATMPKKLPSGQGMTTQDNKKRMGLSKPIGQSTNAATHQAAPLVKRGSCSDVWGGRIQMGVAAKKAWGSRKSQLPPSDVSPCPPFRCGGSANTWPFEGGVLV